MTVICASIVGLWPRDAAANRFQQVASAVRGAKSIVVRAEVLTSAEPGKWKELSRMFYLDGMWRFQQFEGSPLETTYIVRDGEVLSNMTALDHATSQPESAYGDDGFMAFKGDAMDLAKVLSDEGDVSTPRAMRVRPHANVSGRATYEIEMKRPDADSLGLEYSGWILVDKQTNLPIEAYAHSRNRSVKDEDSQVRWFFDFNQPVDRSLFSLNPGKRLVNLEAMQKMLGMEWAASFFSQAGLNVRDVCVSSDRTVWVAYSRAPRSFTGAPANPPISVRPFTGDPYLRSIVMTPSYVMERKNRFQVDGEDVEVASFVPLHAPKTPPTTFVLNIAGVEIDLSPRKEKSVLPSYFVTLDLDHYSPQIPRNLALTRASAAEKAGDYALAASAHEAAANADLHFIRRLAKDEWGKAAALYRKAGRASDASRVEALAAKQR
jgi:hypothetical protein